MPTIIKPDPLITASGRSRDRVASSAPDLLRGASFSDWKYNTKVLRSSFSFPDGDRSVVSNKNGFAHTVIRAWQQDLHLRLRPDDVWLAILAQFSFFVNGNAEALRPIFVAHEGQTKLVVDARPDTIETINVGAIAQQLAWMVKQKLKDPGIATTLLPEFTTTTPHDRATAAMVFLGTMQEYFGYGIRMGCSFPSVTLLGERSDWADMLERVAWFGTIDHDDATEWTTRLTKVLEYMVGSFDRPEHTDVRDFWNHAVHEAGNGSSGGMVTLSGWLTAFCWWGCDGKRVQTYSDQELVRFSRLRGPDGYRRLTLDGVEFPVIERKTVPTGIVRVPLTLHQEGLAERKATVVVGSIGMQVIKEDDETVVQPASGWWMLS
jgi:hypothetical protein